MRPTSRVSSQPLWGMSTPLQLKSVKHCIAMSSFEVLSDFQPSPFPGSTASILRVYGNGWIGCARGGLKASPYPTIAMALMARCLPITILRATGLTPSTLSCGRGMSRLLKLLKQKAPRIRTRYCPKMTNGQILRYFRCEPLPVSPVTPTGAMSEMR